MKQPITQHAPLHGARLKKCAACGQVKPLTAYTARGHKRCSDCIGYTHGRAGANGRLRRPANAPITNATTTELYDGAELRTPVRPGALDAFAWPSRYGSRLVYRDGREGR